MGYRAEGPCARRARFGNHSLRQMYALLYGSGSWLPVFRRYPTRLSSITVWGTAQLRSPV